MTRTRVLVVEDDAVLGAALVASLADAYDVRWAKDCEQARAAFSVGDYDLLLLDLGLPDGDGVELCRECRAADEGLVIVVVTARTDESDAVAALDAGADDFVTKPYRASELKARLRAHLRRRDTAGVEELRVGQLRLDLRGRRAWLKDEEIPLRPKEFELLALLADEAGNAVRRERLIDDVWDVNWSGSTKTLDVHVSNLRRKLADAGDRWDRIVTLRGFGYRFERDDP